MPTFTPTACPVAINTRNVALNSSKLNPPAKWYSTAGITASSKTSTSTWLQNPFNVVPPQDPDGLLGGSGCS